MSNDEKKHHEYDGIVELDNPLPSWWLWSFLLTIIFAALYYLHYEIAGGPTLTDELKVAMTELEQVRSQSAPAPTDESEESLKALFADESLIAIGKGQFDSKCASCHGTQLEGGIGPNLTDKYWLHGKGSRMDLVHVIRKGIPEKGMPPWESILKPQEVQALAAFIIGQRGTNPAKAKAPQGEAFDNYLNSDW